MIKIYLDWNIMSSMKQGGFVEFESVIRDKNKFLPIYSTSHIGDILTSNSENEKQKEVIIDDLNYITSITDNNCFFNDGKNIQLGFMSPIELFNERVESQDLFKDFSIDKLFSPFDEEDDEVLSPLVNILKNLLKLTPLDKGFKDAFENPQSASEMEKIFPGLKEDLSFEGWFKYFGNFYTRLNETEDYKELRNSVQKVGVNSGHFNKNKNPFEIINDAYKKLGVNNPHTLQINNSNENAPEWFNEISNEYLLLDMHGYKQDKIKVTDKHKSTFKNTTEDSFHTAFASRCDFYITNDKKNISKAKAVYSKLKIDTVVYTPDEFIEYYKEFLDFTSFDEHLGNLIDVLETGKGYYAMGNETDENETPIGFVGFSNHYFFNFFNKVRICKSSSDNSLFYLLSKNNPAKIYYTTLREIENLVINLIDNFGVDDQGKGQYVIGEIDSEQWLGRTWTLERMQISLKRINGWFQLYFYPIKNEKKPSISSKIKGYLKKGFLRK